MGSIPTIEGIHAQFHQDQLKSTDLINNSLDRINDPDGEGTKSFIEVYSDQARKHADISDQMFSSSACHTLPLLGLPISIKDLFDIKDTRTKAGSLALKDVDPATKHATIIHRLIQAGAIIIGRTNMTEFAYSGVGLNPHYGTPASPFERSVRRIPGGSSSGSGVSVADRMAVASIGTDTGGSVRIPAALCGVTGFKPTARRVPTTGVFPLSSTFDSVGPLAPSVQCCITLDQIMSGMPVTRLSPFPLKHLRFAIPNGIPLNDLDHHVALCFERAIDSLQKAGANLTEVQVQAFDNPERPSSGARMLAAEAYAAHRSLLDQKKHLYDPRVSTRIQPASGTSAADYIDLISWRKDFIKSVTQELHAYDAILMPTTPMIAPPISELEQSDTVYFQTNMAMLRNTCIVNQMDGCALSIPCHKEDEPPVGLMVAGLAMEDRKILEIGLAIEKVLNQQ